MKEDKNMWDFDNCKDLVAVLHNLTGVRVLKPNGNKSWELQCGRLKTYREGIIIQQIGGKNEQYD